MWLILPGVTVVMVLLALWESRYFYQGKHRGVYAKNPDWYPPLKPVEPFWVFKNVHITIPHGLGPPGSSAVMTISPSGSLTSLPTLIPGIPGEFNNEQFGRWGDADFNPSDYAPLRPPLSDEDLGGGGWIDRGTIDTAE